MGGMGMGGMGMDMPVGGMGMGMGMGGYGMGMGMGGMGMGGMGMGGMGMGGMGMGGMGMGGMGMGGLGMGGLGAYSNYMDPTFAVGRYGYGRNHIDQYAMMSFLKYDLNRSGALGLNELILAFNEFALMTGIGGFNPLEIQALAMRFDFDRNGVITFGEYRIMLEILCGLRPMVGYGQTSMFMNRGLF